MNFCTQGLTFITLLMAPFAFGAPTLVSGNCSISGQPNRALKTSIEDPSSSKGELVDGFLVAGNRKYSAIILYENLKSFNVLVTEYDGSDQVLKNSSRMFPVSETGVTDLDPTFELGDTQLICHLKIDTREKYPDVSSFVTRKGSVFQRVNYKNFGTAWKTPEGMIWSTYQGAFTNTGVITDNLVTNSPATEACASIGGRLPTIEDYRTLMNHFEDEQGEDAKSFRIFSDDMSGVYWTASALNGLARMMVRMDDFGDLAATQNKFAVRCINLE